MSHSIPVPVQLNVETNSEQYALSVSEQNIPISFQIGTAIVADTTRTYDGPYSVTPTEEQQTLQTTDLKMTDDVTVGAIPSDYVGSDVPRHDSSDLVTSGATVSVPAGHYAENASKSIQNATVQSGTNVTVNPTLSVNYDTGEITASVSKTQSVNVVTEAGYAPVTSHNVVMSGSAATQLITHDSSDLTVNGPTVTAPDGYYPNSASKTVQSGSAATPTLGIEATPNIAISNSGKITSSVSKAESITPVVSEGYVTAGTAGTVTFAGSNTLQLNTKSGATITPTESQQVAVEQNRWTTGQVKVGAISSSYVGSGVTRNDSTDLSVSDATVTVPAGYYENAASATVQSATWKSASTIGVVPSISVDANGLITATASGWTSCKPLSASGYADADTSANLQLSGSKTSQLATIAATTYTPNKVSTQEIPAGKYTTGIQTIGKIPDEYIVPSGTKSITSNGTSIDVTSYASVNVAVPSQSATLQSKTKSYTPSETAQSETVSADAGYDGLSSVDVSVGAISSTYVGSGIDRRDSTNLSASGATVTAPAGYYESAATKTISSGTATAPASISSSGATASDNGTNVVLTKTVSVTPSVTAGYIASGTAGNCAITMQATDANFLAENIKSGVSLFGKTGSYTGGGGTSKNTQVVQGTTRTTSSTLTAIGAELTVSKTGTYDIYWSAFRSNTSTSYTYGTQLYIDGSAHGTQNTTWSNHVQNNHLTAVSLTLNQKLRVYGRESRGSSYYIYAPTLVIVEN